MSVSSTKIQSSPALEDSGQNAVRGLATVTPIRPQHHEGNGYRGNGTDRPARFVRRVRRTVSSDAGMATAEYAIVTLAAVGFAGLMVLILQSGEVRGMLMALIQRALSFG